MLARVRCSETLLSSLTRLDCLPLPYRPATLRSATLTRRKQGYVHINCICLYLFSLCFMHMFHTHLACEVTTVDCMACLSCVAGASTLTDDVDTTEVEPERVFIGGGSYTRTQLQGLKVPILKDLCRQARVKVSGTKMVLVERVWTNLGWAGAPGG